MRPPTLSDCGGSPLLTDEAHGLDLTLTDAGATIDCMDCQFFDMEEGGKDCAFEAAAMIGIATPELARLFGWTEDAGEWDAPAKCPWFRDRSLPQLPFYDPLQLDCLTPEKASVNAGAETLGDNKP